MLSYFVLCFLLWVVEECDMVVAVPVTWRGCRGLSFIYRHWWFVISDGGGVSELNKRCLV